jgi:hypothetical protein
MTIGSASGFRCFTFGERGGDSSGMMMMSLIDDEVCQSSLETNEGLLD